MTLPQQTYKMKTEIQEQCTICYEIIDSTNPTVITEEILKHLQLLNTNINVALLQQAVICESCLVKIKSACKFKTSYLDLQQIYLNIKTEDEGYAQKQIVCEICKITVNARDTVPLFDPVAKTNKLMLINYLSPELESKSRNYPQTCESCHKSVLIFCNITNLLSTLDQETCELYLKGCVITKQEPPPDSHSISANSSEHCSMDIKEELQDLINEQSNVEYNKFFIKNEELDLKMDSEEEPGDVGKWKRQELAVGKYFSEIAMGDNSFTNVNESVKVKMFQCNMCEFKTKYKYCIKRHVDMHKNSNEIVMFHCESCGYRTPVKTNFKRHRLIHQQRYEIKTFQCDMCDYKAKEKRDLKLHMLRHKKPDEVEMFQCEICDYKTKQERFLKTHMLIHKKPDEVKMFQCALCDHKTRHRRCLKIHLLRHKKLNETELLQCDICGSKIKDKYYLKKHMLIHKNPDKLEMFQCELCKYKTREKGNINRHMLVHKKPGEVEMFQCGVCDFTTKHKDYLKKHNVLVHKKAAK